MQLCNRAGILSSCCDIACWVTVQKIQRPSVELSSRGSSSTTTKRQEDGNGPIENNKNTNKNTNFSREQAGPEADQVLQREGGGKVPAVLEGRRIRDLLHQV